jgi:hypothetical protein
MDIDIETALSKCITVEEKAKKLNSWYKKVQKTRINKALYSRLVESLTYETICNFKEEAFQQE